MLTNKQPT